MFRRLGLTAVLLILTMVSVVIFRSDNAHDQSPELDLSKLSMVFREDFDERLSVSPWGPNTRWTAHTPWHGEFGDAQFADPVLGFPFTVSDGILRPTRTAVAFRCSTAISKCAPGFHQGPAFGLRFGWGP